MSQCPNLYSRSLSNTLGCGIDLETMQAEQSQNWQTCIGLKSTSGSSALMIVPLSFMHHGVMAKVYVGLSGYSYKEWQGEGLFYPLGLKQADYLKHYSAHYPTVEAPGMWQRMPTPSTISKYIEQCPAGFQLSPKMHQKVTHLSRLKPEGFETLAAFAEQLVPLEKAGMLGQVLIQLPPNLARKEGLLETFLASMPKRPTLRWAFEFRHDSWRTAETQAALREAGAGWVITDTDDETVPRIETADHVYVRLRKIEYTDDELKDWASFFRDKVAEGKDCHVYCRHTDVETPWRWADRLLELI